jgi:hypothetical protein
MSVTKTIQGYYEITDIINGQLVRRVFIGYTKKEAIKKFNKEKYTLKFY